MTRREDNSLVHEIQKVLIEDKDFLKRLLTDSIQSILHSEFESFIKAAHYERSSDRQGYRNGSYTRRLNTRVGCIELEVCRDRDGLFQTELFGRYQRSEQALVLSMVEMYLQGVSTRRVNSIVQELCGLEISRSQVSSLARELDKKLSSWRERKIEKEYPYLVVDARYERIRGVNGVKSKAVMIVVGISCDGYREILSIDVSDSENESDWGQIFKRLKDRGLSGVVYVVSDDHEGLVKALGRYFQGSMWQRCQVHFIRNFISKMGRRDSRRYLPLLKDIFASTSREDAIIRKRRLVEELTASKPNISQWIDEEIEFCLTIHNLPESHRRRMRSTNMLERFNQELKRRSRVVRIFPNEASCIRLLGTLSMEQSEEWETGKMYLNMKPDLKEKPDQEWIWQKGLNLASATLQPS